MSLSDLLLGGSSSKKSAKAAIDSDLDALFRSTAPIAPAASTSEQRKKRKSKDVADVLEVHDREAKKPKSAFKDEASSSKKGKEKADHTEPPDPVVEAATSKKVKKSKKKMEEKAESGDEEDDDELEQAYSSGKPSTKNARNEVPADSEEEGDPSTLVHESVAKAGKGKGGVTTKSKYIPDDETPERRDERTIFIGNLSVEVAQKRPLLKQLQKHILAQVPNAKIESTRLRSIPFLKPTSKLPTSDDEGTSKPSTATAATKSTPRQHDRDRMAAWREAAAAADKDDAEIKADEKKFLNPAQKKKIAFINGEFHSTADSVNAYLVFAHPAPAAARPANLPPVPETMDPYEAAKLAAEKCDGTLFMERMIRVDLACKSASGEHVGLGEGNPKLSVFVGNLDFACKEEDLRVFFEGVVSAERGPPGADTEQNGDGERKGKAWVTRVRIVRDKETQLGKGFAYVQFLDRECVDEILSMEEAKLKFAKRKLRVQRCKALTTGSKPAPKATTAPKSRTPATPIAIPSIPKGDPTLGEKLAHLAKDERKQIKSSDADRVARRLAKKKARSALEKQGVRAQVKDRDRTRRSVSEKRGLLRKEVGKGRIRSEKSVAKRNTKK